MREFASHISQRGLISKIFNKLIKHNNKKKKKGFNTNKGPEEMFFQRRHVNGQQAHEKVLNITNDQGNASQNHTKKTPHTG